MQINPSGIASHPDPYPIYAALRQQDPVYRSHQNIWAVTRYADVEALLTDPRFGHWTSGSQTANTLHERLVGRWVQLLNPHHNSHLRTAMNRFLSQTAAEAKRAHIRDTVDEVFQRAEGDGCLDIVTDLAEPLTLSVFGDILGVPPEDRPRFKHLAHDLQGGLYALMLGRSAAPTFQAFMRYVQTLIEHKHHALGEDLISALIQAHAAGDDLTMRDFVPFTLMFLYAGHDNMMNFIGNGALALLRHPEQWERLREEPDCIDTAVEELLRFESPVQYVKLVARSDVTLREKTIRAGDTVSVLIGSANRDAAQFQSPDQLDITRQPNRHLSFGAGAMYCIGSALARVQGQVAIQALVEHCDPTTSHDAPLQWRSAPNFLRGLVSLPLRLLPHACVSGANRSHGTTQEGKRCNLAT